MRKRLSATYLLLGVLAGITLSQLHSSRAIAADPAERKYKLVDVEWSKMDEELNKNAAEGWKLNSTVIYDANHSGDPVIRFVFEK